MVRAVTHQTTLDVNSRYRIDAMDEPSFGGANHEYQVAILDSGGTEVGHFDAIRFQNGPVQNNIMNGFTEEILLSIVADRLTSFQHGDFACDENENALGYVNEALAWLEARTKRRIAAKIEGQNREDPASLARNATDRRSSRDAADLSNLPDPADPNLGPIGDGRTQEQLDLDEKNRRIVSDESRRLADMENKNKEKADEEAKRLADIEAKNKNKR